MSDRAMIVPSDKQLSIVKAEKSIALAVNRAYDLIVDLREQQDVHGLGRLDDGLSLLKSFAQKEDVSRPAQNSIAEAKLRTQRVAGEVWIGLPRVEGGSLGGTIDRSAMTGMADIPKTGGKQADAPWKNKTQMWRQIAESPEALFEAYITDVTTTNGDELTTAGFVKQAKKWRQQENARNRSATVAEVDKNVHVGMFQTMAEKIGENKVDLIFTDPPYDVPAVDLYADLSAFAAHVLRPGGICMAYAGQFTLPDAIINLGQNLEYMWVAGIKHTGGELRFRKYHIHNAWKPILVFYKAPLECWWDWFSDMIDGGGQNKEYHKWGQALSEALYYIKAASPEGGVVVDPMCGGGTSLVAAKGLGMKYIGIDVDATAVNNAKHALSTVKKGQFLPREAA